MKWPTIDAPAKWRIGRLTFGLGGTALAVPFVILTALLGYDLPHGAAEWRAAASVVIVGLAIVVGMVWVVAFFLTDDDGHDGPWKD